MHSSLETNSTDLKGADMTSAKEEFKFEAFSFHDSRSEGTVTHINSKCCDVTVLGPFIM